MASNYWTRTLQRRIGRRRVLALAGGSAAAAAFLAACGGDDDDGGGGTGGTSSGGTSGSTGGDTTSGLVTKPEYVGPGQATRGGVLKDFARAEPRSLDPVNPQSDLETFVAVVYQTLLFETPGKLEPPAYQLEGGLAESWERTPDGMQITFKLRRGVKFHNIPPVSGREFDADDVLFSFNRHKELAPLQALVWNEVSDGGFIRTVSAPDSSTIVVDLAEPLAYAENWFAVFAQPAGQLLIYPKEAADQNVLDLRQTMIGTGPFYVKEHEPSVKFTMARNLDYWDPDFALVDEIQQPILPEYIARQTQFKAGEIYIAGGPTARDILRAEDVLPLKNDQPEALLYEAPMQANSTVMTFGWLPRGENPYKDERVRRAISMAFDRDLDIGVRFNVEEFEEAGLPVRTAWNSHLAARDQFRASGYFLDPQGDDFGPNAQYFQYNPDEAMKLLTAAGYPDGFDVKFGYPNAANFDRGNVVEPFFFFLQQIGLNVIDNGYEDYTQGYIPFDRDASGEFEGMGYHSVTGGVVSVVSPTSALVAEHLPASGITFHGYSENMDGSKAGDPELIAMLQKAKVEQDNEARKELVKEAQRHLGGKMWNLLDTGGATSYWMAWPAVRNFPVFQGGHPWARYQIWIDPTKAPLA